MSKKIVKKNKHDGFKIAVLLLVITACFYFIWQYVFVQNSKKSNAKDYKTDVCCEGDDHQCSKERLGVSGYSCQDIPKGIGLGFHGCVKTCQPKNYRRPR